MKHLLLSVALVLGTLPTLAQRGNSFQSNQREFFEQVNPVAKDAVKVSRDISQHVYLCAGYSTYLEFPAKPPIERVYVGAEKLVKVDVDKIRNAVVLTPVVATGHTNLTVVFQGVPYVWELHLRNAGEVNYRLTYSVPTTEAAVTMPYGPAVIPSAVPVAELMTKISSYGLVAPSPKDARNIFYRSMGTPITWNGQCLTVTDAFGFVKENVVVLRVHRRNVCDTIKYLDVKQIGVWVANTQFPATVGLQSAAQLYPGQAEMIYIFLQGYGLTVDNDFLLRLPPDSDTVESYLAQSK